MVGQILCYRICVLILLLAFTMALARWARSESPKPYTLYTRREVYEWVLPHIDKTDTLFSV